MKTVDVNNQPKMGFSQTFRMGINDLQFRLFRSAVTLMVIAVAVAFMMNIVCEAISMRSVARIAQARTQQQRLASYWVARLTAPGTVEEIIQELGNPSVSAAIAEEARVMSGLSESDYAAYRNNAAQAAQYLRFFDKLDYGRRRILVRDASGVGILDRLRNPENFASFEEALKPLKSVRVPHEVEGLRSFLNSWPAIKEQTARIQEARRLAIAKVADAVGDQSMVAALVKADGALGDSVRSAGFTAFDAQIAKTVAVDSAEREDTRKLEESVQNTDIRGQIAIERSIVAGDVTPDILWSILAKRGSAEWYLGKLKKLDILPPGMTPERAVYLAGIKADKDLLDRSLVQTTVVEGGFLGVGSRMAWLVIISCLVCVVGIANAMLMAVTERFREIATLKCLGALDGYIMLLFVVEACLLGLVGGLAGGIIGSVIGFSRMAIAFQELLFGAFPGGPWAAAMGFAVLLGGFLATIAGVYPSYIAARLAPMEAMRIE